MEQKHNNPASGNGNKHNQPNLPDAQHLDPNHQSQDVSDQKISQADLISSSVPSFEDIFYASQSGSKETIQKNVPPPASVESEKKHKSHESFKKKEKKSRLESSEATEGEIVDSNGEDDLFHDPSEEDEEQIGGFQDKVREMLAESNIDRTKIRNYCLGCFVVLAFVALGFYGFSRFWGEKSEKEPIPEVVDETVDVPSVSPEDSINAALKTSYLVGNEHGSFVGFRDKSLYFAYLVGSESERFTKRFTQQVDILKEVKNVLDTDLFRLLDQSRNREVELENYRHVLEEQDKNAVSVMNELSSLLDLLQVQFNNNVSPKKQYEERFFSALRTLSGRESLAMLESFSDIAQEQVGIKSRFKALQKLSDFYDILLRRIRTRLSDIELNKEALIKGVQVIDIAGSELDLVIESATLEE